MCNMQLRVCCTKNICQKLEGLNSLLLMTGVLMGHTKLLNKLFKMLILKQRL